MYLGSISFKNQKNKKNIIENKNSRKILFILKVFNDCKSMRLNPIVMMYRFETLNKIL